MVPLGLGARRVALPRVPDWPRALRGPEPVTAHEGTGDSAFGVSDLVGNVWQYSQVPVASLSSKPYIPKRSPHVKAILRQAHPLARAFLAAATQGAEPCETSLRATVALARPCPGQQAGACHWSVATPAWTVQGSTRARCTNFSLISKIKPALAEDKLELAPDCTPTSSRMRTPGP